MENYYKILGIASSATPEEIRRAYRILARRYHPDVNPGEASTEKFKHIAQAYETLSDSERKKNYDIELENHLKLRGKPAEQAYRRAARAAERAAMQAEARRRYQHFQTQSTARSALKEPAKKGADYNLAKAFANKVSGALTRMRGKKTSRHGRKAANTIQKFSVVEVSIALRDAIVGIKKTIEIAEPEGRRKVSVRIPPGSRNGTVIHLRSTNPPGEEIVLIVRVAVHPTMLLQQKGLVVEIPVTVMEALQGASITVPTLDDPISIKVPPGTQSGTELRVRGRGVLQKDGSRGDLFYRVLIKLPISGAIETLKEKAKELDQFYETPVRQELPRTLLD